MSPESRAALLRAYRAELAQPAPVLRGSYRPHEIARLREIAATTVGVKLVVKEMGRTRECVLRMAASAGIEIRRLGPGMRPPRRYPQAEVERLRAIAAVTIGVEAVCRAFGRNRDVVRRMAKQGGITIHRAPRPDRHADSFWAAHDGALEALIENQGLTAREAAERLGVTKNAVIGRAYRLGLRFARSIDRAIERLPEFPPGGGCLFSTGDPKTAEFSFCGAKADAGSPWCPEHRRRVFVPAGKRAAAEAALERAAASGGINTP